MGPLMRAIGALGLGAAFSVGSASAPAEDACARAHARADSSRAAEVSALLGETPDGARLAASGTRAPVVCFGDGEGGVTPEGIAILDRAAPPRAQAARLAHLWQHAHDGAPRAAPASGEACDAWLAEVERAEARGDATEARVAGALGVASRAGGRSSRDASYRARCP